MGWNEVAFLLALFGLAAGQFRAFPGGRKASEDFDCPEDFGYYSHPTDCTRYYVCVFGGALEELCSSGLVYSDELLTCDWPRNVQTCDPVTLTPRPPLAGSSSSSSSSGSSSRSSSISSGSKGRRLPARSRGVSALAASTPSVRTRQPTVRRPAPRPTAVRNNLDDRSSSRFSTSLTRDDPAAPASIADRLRLLDNIDRRPANTGRGFEEDTNKIVTRRQQKLLSPDSSGGRGRFQQPAVQSLQSKDFRIKPTDAPIRISTISSFSFGDTGTRFPERERPSVPSRFPEPERPSVPSRFAEPEPQQLPTRFPPRQPPSTFVSSTRGTTAFPTDLTSVTRQTPASRPAVTEPTFPQSASPSPSPSGPTVQSYTEPAYVAYFNDTIYDVYYIYDDDEVVYDDDYADDVTTATGRPSPSSFSTGIRDETTRPTTEATPNRRPLSKRPSTRLRPTGRRRVTGSRQSSAGRGKARGSFSTTSDFSKTSAVELSSVRGSTLGSTFSSRPPASSFSTATGSRRPASTFATGSTRGVQDTTTEPAARKRLVSKNIGKGFTTSSRRTPSTGLKSIDTSSSRRPNRINSGKSSHRNRGSTTPAVNIWAHPPRRPDPVYPQPYPDEKAERCDARCKLPDCYCGGTANPGGIPSSNVPQLVLLTFDDSVNDLNRALYKEMFEEGRVNPNGCPIAATFYVSHEWTDYKQVQNLYADGHEIASHSISHSFGEQFSVTKWEKEIAGQREILAAYGGVRLDDIRGMRAPFLSIGGNRMFKMLYNSNFTYDSSMPIYENDPPSWPYTLDYKIHHDCMIPPCPNKAYPGVWEVPMVMWQDLSGGRCSMVDACTAPSTAEEVYNMLIKNFKRHYTSNRAVFPLYFHAAWFTTQHHREGFMAFLDTISKMDDVWLVTNWQAIQWMRDPQPLSTVNSFKPFGCDYPERPARCTKARKCNLWHKSGVRYMTTCQPCPDKYPWTGHTGVASRS